MANRRRGPPPTEFGRRAWALLEAAGYVAYGRLRRRRLLADLGPGWTGWQLDELATWGRVPPDRDARELAAVLGCSPADLIGGGPSPLAPGRAGVRELPGAGIAAD